MLTPREQAAGAYQGALAQGRGNVVGGEMAVIIRGRRLSLIEAERTIEAARGSDRSFLREPDDAALGRMLVEVRALRDGFEIRWDGPLTNW